VHTSRMSERWLRQQWQCREPVTVEGDLPGCFALAYDRRHHAAWASQHVALTGGLSRRRRGGYLLTEPPVLLPFFSPAFPSFSTYYSSLCITRTEKICSVSSSGCNSGLQSLACCVFLFPCIGLFGLYINTLPTMDLLDCVLDTVSDTLEVLYTAVAALTQQETNG
jgi:hypothetical protein